MGVAQLLGTCLVSGYLVMYTMDSPMHVPTRAEYERTVIREGATNGGTLPGWSGRVGSTENQEVLSGFILCWHECSFMQIRGNKITWGPRTVQRGVSHLPVLRTTGTFISAHHGSSLWSHPRCAGKGFPLPRGDGLKLGAYADSNTLLGLLTFLSYSINLTMVKRLPEAIGGWSET